jgi:hypothetical protein
VTTSKFLSAAVLVCITLLLLGGCVTFEKTEDGTKFFKTDKENKWENFQENMSATLKEGQGKMTMGEVKKMFPIPIVERNTGESKALGWYFHKSRNSIWDFAVVSTSNGMDLGYLLSIGFTEKEILSNFELQRVVVPSKNRTITSKPIVNEAIMIKNMQILDSMIDRTLSKNVDRADSKLNTTLDNHEAEFTGKVKDAVSSANNASGGTGTITIQGTAPGGSYSYTVTGGR